MIPHEGKKKKKKSFQIKNELPTKLFPTPTTELPDRIVSNRDPSLLDADFDAPARSKNEYDSSDEENERMEELLGV